MKPIVKVLAVSILSHQAFSESNQDGIEHPLILSSPEHVGLAHTHIIDNLQRSLLEHTPQNHIEYLHAVSLEMRKVACEHDDRICNSHIVQRTIDLQPGPPLGQAADEINLKHLMPEGFDQEVLDSIENLVLSANIAELHRPKDIVEYMNKNFEIIKHSETISNERDRDIALLAYSVGIESAKQWAEILKDPKNPFNLITSKGNNGNRKLQFGDLQFGDQSDEELNISFKNILQSDILGSVTGAIESVFESSEEKTILQLAMQEASIASLKSFGDNFISSAIPGFPGGAGVGAVGSPDGCDFPNAFWCDENLNGASASNNNNDDEDCLFPGSPMCNGNVNNIINNLGEGMTGIANRPTDSGGLGGGNGQGSFGRPEGSNGLENFAPPGMGNGPDNLEGGIGGPNGSENPGGVQDILNSIFGPINDVTITGLPQTSGGPGGFLPPPIGGGGGNGNLGGFPGGNSNFRPPPPPIGVGPGGGNSSVRPPPPPPIGSGPGNGNVNVITPPASNNPMNGNVNSQTNNGPKNDNDVFNVDTSSEWEDDNVIWSDSIPTTSGDTSSPISPQSQNSDCPFPGQPRCGKLIKATAQDGTPINCKNLNSPLCQMALGTYEEQTMPNVQVQVPPVNQLPQLPQRPQRPQRPRPEVQIPPRPNIQRRKKQP